MISPFRFWDIEHLEEIMLKLAIVIPFTVNPYIRIGSLLYTGDLGGFGAIWDLRIGKL